MLTLYLALSRLAHSDFSDIVVNVGFVGGTPASPNKLRLTLMDGSYLDIWLSADGDYAFHWEQRRQSGRLYRWDNAPHHRTISTFPAHFYDGDESIVMASHLHIVPELALREVLEFVRQRLR